VVVLVCGEGWGVVGGGGGAWPRGAGDRGLWGGGGGGGGQRGGGGGGGQERETVRRNMGS